MFKNQDCGSESIKTKMDPDRTKIVDPNQDSESDLCSFLYFILNYSLLLTIDFV